MAAVQEAFRRPLPVVVDRSKLLLDPTRVASAYSATAVARARIAAPGSSVQLVVAVRGPALRAWLAAASQRFARAPVDASLKLKNGKPLLTRDRPGRRLDTASPDREDRDGTAGEHAADRTRANEVDPREGVGRFVRRDDRHQPLDQPSLALRHRASSGAPSTVATGQAIYPTPAGVWHIVVKWKNPTWYPPVQDAWARGLKPVPPGPDNPLGTRWMGLDAPGVGIHGTDEPASIGYSASHGCIRMQVPDAEWLFDHVDVGTTVYIL